MSGGGGIGIRRAWKGRGGGGCRLLTTPKELGHQSLDTSNNFPRPVAQAPSAKGGGGVVWVESLGTESTESRYVRRGRLKPKSRRAGLEQDRLRVARPGRVQGDH